MTRPGTAAAVAFCVSLLALSGANAQSLRYEGQKIAGIFLEPRDQPLTRDQIGLSLGVRPGDEFDELQLSKAIQRLYATGRYSNIVVDAESGADGVTLTFRTTPAYFVSGVSVTGVPEPPNPARLNNATRLDLGMEFDEAVQLPQAEANLLDLLKANGFYGAKVTHTLERKARTQEVNIQFIVEPGERAKFTAPIFSGDPQRSDKKLTRITRWQRWWGLRGWKDLNDRLVQEGLDRLRSHYLKNEHLLANIKLNSLDYDAGENTVQPRVEIQAGPRVELKAEGAKVSQGTLRKLLPVYQERTIDRELLIEGRDNLVEHFQAQGYFDTKVEFRASEPSGKGEQTITYAIDRGTRYRLVHLDVKGNEYFRDDTIRERLSMIPARFPQYRRGRFSNDLLERDKDAIIDLYRSNGFRDVAVSARVDYDYGNKPQDIGVVLEVAEGPQWAVESLDISGVDLRLVETIESLMTSTVGQPFSVSSVATDRDTVLNWYFNNGYPDATMDAAMIPVEGQNKMRLRYTVTEGRRYFVRDVLVNGLEKTRPELVTNRLALAPGDPLSQGSMIETQRRLYDLGIFAQVSAAMQNPLGQERNKYVLLQLDEARKYSLNLGLGAEFGTLGAVGTPSLQSPAGARGFSPRALVSVSRSNFMGLGHTASTTFRVSNYQQRVLLNYLAPQFRGDENVNLTFSGLFDKSSDVRTFKSTRYESSVQLGQRLSRANQVQYRVTFRDVNVDQSSLAIDPSLIPIYSQPVQVTVFSGAFIQDRRDDPVDSTRGIYNTIDAGYAPAALAKQTSYTRTSMRNSTYHQLSRSVVLARTATFGWLYNLAPNPVPLPERFYAGGATTHRGFPENQAGPRDPVTGFPVGGNSFLFFGTELRFPLIGQNLGAVLFHDMGNVYSSFDKISFRYRQRDRTDFDYMVQAAGLGIRVKTPVGPIRVDFAYAPNSPRFVGFKGSYDDLINGRGQHNVPQRVRPFQFHFSIGQSF